MNNSLKFIFALIIIFSVFFNISAQTPNADLTNKSYQFINGQWFDGKGFKKRTFYSVNGFFSDKKPVKIDEAIDLKNGYVVPPFADAHTHQFDGTAQINQQVKMYLANGIYYVKVQTNTLSGAKAVADKVNKPDSVDVAYSHGALTHTYGHGIEIYEAIALGFYFDIKLYNANIEKIAASRLRENDAYYIIDTEADLENKWQKILAGKPDFIKIYLLTSENYDYKSKNIGKFSLGGIGLDPKLVPLIVQKAHAAGLRVSAHVDTVTDFRIALKGGVDEMAHLPGYYVSPTDKLEKYLLTESDAKEAAKRKIWIVPAPVVFGGIEPAIRERTDEVLKRNLGLLKKNKVNIAFGSDSYGRSSLQDVLYLNKIGIYSNLETLRIWSQNSPQTIFPKRKIGFLKSGYEANFLVLDKNPLENFENVKSISLRFKQGHKIELPN